MMKVDALTVVGQPALAAARDHGDVLMRYLAAACITQQDHKSKCELATDVSFIHKIKVTAVLQSCCNLVIKLQLHI